MPPRPEYTLVVNGTCNGGFVINKKLTLQGATGSALDGGTSEETLFIGSSAKVKITGLSVIDGGGTLFGGGIENLGTLTLSRSTVSGNTSGSVGGGIDNKGRLTLTGSSVAGNYAVAGAGVYNAGNATLTVSSSIVSGNTATGTGGGIGNDGGTLVLLNSVVSGNIAGAGGGVISGGGDAVISGSTVSGNDSSAAGGGIYSSASTLSVSGSTISGNSSGSGGGGMALFGVGSVTISNSTMTQNSTIGDGGAVYKSGPTTFSVSHSTISDNSATGLGGGISGGSMSMDSSIMAGNHAGSLLTQDCDAIVGSAGYNLIGDADGCAFFPAAGDQVGSASGSGVIDPLLSPLASNGGKTQTMALAVASPAVDAIPIGPLCSAGSNDQRGTARPQGNACDIGAYEVKAPWIAAVVVVSGLSGGSPSVSGTITCNQGSSFAVSITLTQGQRKAVGASPSAACNGLTPVPWTVPVAPGTFAPAVAKVSYSATAGTVKKSGKTTLILT